jgi:CheY-like chemotaxis protein
MNSHDTIDFMHKTLKLKISKKLMHKICTNEVCISKGLDGIINLTLLFDLIEFHEAKDQFFMEIPEEGDIFLPLTTCEGGVRDMSNFVDVLIVDDIEINIEILRKMLENLESQCSCCRNHRKYSINTANSGRAALDMILCQHRNKSGYKIVIMDCLMPGMDGWETSLEINKMFSQGVIKYLPYIIAYSAFDSKEDLEKCIVSGMCCHISKPCLKEELCQAINDWITRF